ncbi:MAG TPA: alpha/beta hydrolase [Chloroflexota bacterium]|nr:alpha/beta hydrolase [Chloroflexota bacterium]
MIRALEHHFTTSAPRLHYVSAGPRDGLPVFLLHGFPDFWYGWRHQIPALAAAGLRVYALDQRGYNTSAKPPGVSAYTLDQLASDVLRLADEVAPGRPIDVVGHDFGAAVAWWLAAFRPERLHRQVIVNVPHPAVFTRTVRRDPRQLLRSWYIAAVQLPRLPELLLSAGGYRSLTNALVKSARPGAFSPNDLRAYREAWSQPGALTAMLNWYRAGWSSAALPAKPVSTPTFILWGRHDVALIPEMAPASRDLCHRAELVTFDHCSHWPHLEEAHLFNQHLTRFLVSEG